MPETVVSATLPDQQLAPDEFHAFLIADMDKWADVVKRSGAKLE